MTVTSVDTDYETLSLTLTAEFAAPVERVWQLWSDPRRLERWWGPPSWPATVEDHDLSPGGTVTYFMTGPDGDKARGWWRVGAVDPPHGLQFVDGFADADGTPNETMPTTSCNVELTEHAGRTRMVIRSVFDSREQMDQLVNMGMAEGIREAVGQIDAILAE
jgi:uncharacterized protein YndB with AHSA1/START domain